MLEIKVDGQPKNFQLAYSEGWETAVGHGIQVDKHMFCATPIGAEIVVSEATTGMKIIGIPLSESIFEQTDTKEKTMIFYGRVGVFLKTEVERIKHFDELKKEREKKTIEQIGERPPITDHW